MAHGAIRRGIWVLDRSHSAEAHCLYSHQGSCDTQMARHAVAVLCPAGRGGGEKQPPQAATLLSPFGPEGSLRTQTAQANPGQAPTEVQDRPSAQLLLLRLVGRQPDRSRQMDQELCLVATAVQDILSQDEPAMKRIPQNTHAGHGEQRLLPARCWSLAWPINERVTEGTNGGTNGCTNHQSSWTKAPTCAARTLWATTGHDTAQQGKQAIRPSPAPGSNAFGGQRTRSNMIPQPTSCGTCLARPFMGYGLEGGVHSPLGSRSRREPETSSTAKTPRRKQNRNAASSKSLFLSASKINTSQPRQSIGP